MPKRRDVCIDCRQVREISAEDRCRSCRRKVDPEFDQKIRDRERKGRRGACVDCGNERRLYAGRLCKSCKKKVDPVFKARIAAEKKRAHQRRVNAPEKVEARLAREQRVAQKAAERASQQAAAERRRRARVTARSILDADKSGNAGNGAESGDRLSAACLTLDDVYRLLSKVDMAGNDECWNWKAGKYTDGYGAFGLRGRNTGAHRIVYALHHGEAPAGKVICHKCGNRACCNPRHLRADTQEANMAEMVHHGTVAKSKAKVSIDQVREIHARLLNGERAEDLGNEYGIDLSSVCSIGSGRTWSHVTGITDWASSVRTQRTLSILVHARVHGAKAAAEKFDMTTAGVRIMLRGKTKLSKRILDGLQLAA